MALHKFSKLKSFHVDYCGCTAAASLLNEQSIRDAINLVRQIKTKHDFVKTRLSASKDGIKIIYHDEQIYSTHVPTTMIAGSTIGKSSLHDTVGVVYISPLTGRHYPAFVHVYRCNSSRIAQKLLVRLRMYTLIENHRLQLIELEQQLLHNDLLKLDHYNTLKSLLPNTTTLDSNKTSTNFSSSSANSSNSRVDKSDPVKSITEELQKKIDSQEPLLFPPKDYDSTHAAHGHIQRAQAWKSTEPTVIGYTPLASDNHRIRRQTYASHHVTNQSSDTDELKETDFNDDSIETNGKSRLSIQKSDTTIDPVETVSLAFRFLKDETDSITTENAGNIEHLEVEQDKLPIFRFRPPPITALTKKLFTRNNNYDFANNLSHRKSSSRNDLDTYYNNTHYQYQQMPNGNRARSETNLYYDSQPGMHLSPRYETRLLSRSGAPIATNPLWTATSPAMVGSQPNLLSNISPQQPVYRHLSPPTQRRTTAVPLQHPLYASHTKTKPSVIVQQKENQQRSSRPLPTPLNSNNKQAQYFDTNEFILRASNGDLLKNSQFARRPSPTVSRDHKSHSIDVNNNGNRMLDVYY